MQTLLTANSNLLGSNNLIEDLHSVLCGVVDECMHGMDSQIASPFI